ncbi:hypothetical protein GCM10009785_01430 [Brooklawnia cerclae]|uniref:Uncharacterized protein n=1 Tax=Brooklawnia cerclae TaxID=349934 RepID=A0ABX0SCZ2_9ACTN|nr:hypothetical protein [Brooklawnia cerclae]NIH56262.1 hypothetical protein [Brooklawnia cerclae]
MDPITVWKSGRLYAASELHPSVAIYSPSWGGPLEGGASGLGVRVTERHPDGSAVVSTCDPITGRIAKRHRVYVAQPSEIVLSPREVTA